MAYCESTIKEYADKETKASTLIYPNRIKVRQEIQFKFIYDNGTSDYVPKPKGEGGVDILFLV